MDSQLRLVLGSQSSFRKRLMEGIAHDLGATFTTTSADIDEKSIRDTDPEQLVVKLAIAKADAILAQGDLDADILVTGDQVVAWQGKILEKPSSEAEARQMLEGYCNSEVRIIAGVSAYNLHTKVRASGFEAATVKFGHIPDEVIDELIAEHGVLHCSGSLRAEHPIMKAHELESNLTEDIAGSLPIILTKRLIQEVHASSIS